MREGQLGPFVLQSELGRGAYGAVFRARHRVTGQEVALKVLHHHKLHEKARQRLRREAEVVASLRHPHVVGVHAAELETMPPYIAFELVEGARSLDRAFQGRGLRERVGLVRDAARGLGAAHALGVVHRDVKPDNVLVDEQGRVLVSDFGLALADSEDGQRLTKTGALVGTPLYMAPELLHSSREAVGPATDVWALGEILYEALTGRRPFEADNLILLAKLKTRPPTPPRELAPEVPRDLEAVCLRALQPRPEDRYADGEALAAALDLGLGDSGPPPSGLPASRTLTMLAVAAGAVAAGAVSLGAWSQSGPQPTPSGSLAPASPVPGPSPWEVAQDPGLDPAPEPERLTQQEYERRRRQPLAILDHAEWDFSLGRRVYGLPLPPRATGSPLEVWTFGDGRGVQRWLLGRSTSEDELPFGGQVVYHLVARGSGDYLAATGDGLYSLVAGVSARRLQGQSFLEEPRTLRPGPGRLLGVSLADRRTVAVLDHQDPWVRVRASIKLPEGSRLRDFGFAPQAGELLVIGSEEATGTGFIERYDARSGARRAHEAGGVNPSCLAVGPDDLIAFGNQFPELRLYAGLDVRQPSGRLSADTPGSLAALPHPVAVRSLCFSSYGGDDRHVLLYSTSGDLREEQRLERNQQLAVWRVRRDGSGGEQVHLAGYLPASLTALAESADGRYLVAARYDGSVEVWDARALRGEY